ncbi:MAG: DEAD/DEAH box helicase family protein [Gammaproteobacteria bacterium]
MQLKDYQQDALEQLDRYLAALKQARLAGETAAPALAAQGMDIPEELTDYPRAAWNILKKQNELPAISQDGASEIPGHITRTAACGAPIPHVCLKVPTGGGKTVLGVAALERIKRGAGFVLWIVPSNAIYTQTINAFRTREHPYRQMLERISGGKVKLLQKSERFTKQDVENYLCVMMLMLPAANRKRNKEFLKMFRDSGGYTSFFPEQDDARANRKLLEQCADLEKTAGGVKQSMFNALKIIRPTVILDEAHKAYGAARGEEFVESVNRLNPRFVLELSATPKIGISNILVNISGRELHDEEMIKLPIEIHNFENSDWKHTLAEAKGKLDQLAADARKLQQRENRYVRPLALVRVERTGADQLGQGKIHADNARKYLIENLAVPENQIRIQSSARKELAGEELLGEASAVRWIITKDALKEGWDCAFAYVLVLLDNTTAPTAMTQLVGRVMRQPHARRMEEPSALNQCAIFCYNQDVGAAVARVRAGLESEGLTGLGEMVSAPGAGGARKPVTPRAKYRRPKVFLPRVLHRAGRGWRLLDYHRDILGAIRWDELDAGDAIDLDDEDTRRAVITSVHLHGQSEVLEKDADTGEPVRFEYFVRRLADAVPNPWQAARIASAFLQKHRRDGCGDARVFTGRIHLSEVLRARVAEAINTAAECAFGGKVGNGAIKFDLKTDANLTHELNKSFDVFVSDNARALQGEHGAPIQSSLFAPVYDGDFNKLERDFALYLDGKAAVTWWHKIAAQQDYKLQGWQRNRVLPDFVVSLANGKLLILETKGMHLSGNPDTAYKQTLLRKLEEVYACADDVGAYETREPAAVFRMLFENSWRGDLNNLLGGHA